MAVGWWPIASYLVAVSNLQPALPGMVIVP
jgi:hypothetical protein